MYGTVARMRVKQGMEAQFQRVARELESERAPGQIAVYAYQMDRDSREFYMAVIFQSKADYVANAQSPEQHGRFLKMMEMLEIEPEWNDGEIVFAV